MTLYSKKRNEKTQTIWPAWGFSSRAVSFMGGTLADNNSTVFKVGRLTITI